ncbi:MAG: hypothetical protein BZY82_04305 [SAR202 cluster bacterium Io17-Chloro-G3]|nr:MAG: hypothetical protein BZY82_04305 [SAR202 cluster bacterium Io17-Chloro-G3]
MQLEQMGIYLNVKEATVVRITSLYWIPEAPDWDFITNDPNASLVSIRESIVAKGLMADSSAVHWGAFPTRE